MYTTNVGNCKKMSKDVHADNMAQNNFRPYSISCGTGYEANVTLTALYTILNIASYLYQGLETKLNYRNLENFRR